MAEMAMRIEGLPTRPLDAAAHFFVNYLPDIRDDFEAAGSPTCLTIVFAQAGHEHRSWRLAAIQELAREVAPHRVNAIVSDSEAAIGAGRSYLARAEGVTGQLLELDDTGAGEVLSSRP